MSGKTLDGGIAIVATRGQGTKVGDVFAIPIDDEHVGYGQVALLRFRVYPLYAIFFAGLYRLSETPALESIVSDDVALCGATMDARIKLGVWRIVGNAHVDLARVPLPYTRVDVAGKNVVIDPEGRVIRPASPHDIAHYMNAFSASPMLYEQALKALHGRASWVAEFDQLRYAWANERSTLSPSN